MTSKAIKHEPRVRPDGRCAAPGCDRQRKPERSKRYGGLIAESDPFCSTECARAYFGTSLRGRPSEKENDGFS